MLQPQQLFAGRYRVIAHLADGGMGAVYEAEHTATEARVALKLLWPHIVQLASARERFELEARIAARVNDDHIVKVLDAGFDPESRAPFLVMELLRGRTLGALIKTEGPLSVELTLELLGQVAAGLDAAHGYRTASGAVHPIVHRDLKPENLFLTQRSDGSHWVKILDFGIAKVLGDATGVSQEIRGTPLYMAYEQAAGEAVSPQTDIWALGLITYFMLTGQRYWPAANRPDSGMPALFAEILSLPLCPPSERLRSHGIGLELPPAFDAWFLRCLQRKPMDRFSSAGRAIEELRRTLSRPVAAPRRTAAPTIPLSLETRAEWRAAAVEHAPPTAVAAAPGTGTHSGASQSLPPVASERLRTATRWDSRTRAIIWSTAGSAIGALMIAGVWHAVFSSRSGDATPTAPTPAASAAGSAEAASAAALAREPTGVEGVPVSVVDEVIVTDLPSASEPTPPAGTGLAPLPATVVRDPHEPHGSKPSVAVESQLAVEHAQPQTEPAGALQNTSAAPSSPKPRIMAAPCKFDPYTGRCAPLAPAAPPTMPTSR